MVVLVSSLLYLALLAHPDLLIIDPLHPLNLKFCLNGIFLWSYKINISSLLYGVLFFLQMLFYQPLIPQLTAPLQQLTVSRINSVPAVVILSYEMY